MKKNKNRGYHKTIVWNDAVGFYARRVMSYMAITPILHHSNNLSLQYSRLLLISSKNAGVTCEMTTCGYNTLQPG
jgi:hypothetical protein